MPRGTRASRMATVIFLRFMHLAPGRRHRAGEYFHGDGPGVRGDTPGQMLNNGVSGRGAVGVGYRLPRMAASISWTRASFTRGRPPAFPAAVSIWLSFTQSAQVTRSGWRDR